MMFWLLICIFLLPYARCNAAEQDLTSLKGMPVPGAPLLQEADITQSVSTHDFEGNYFSIALENGDMVTSIYKPHHTKTKYVRRYYQRGFGGWTMYNLVTTRSHNGSAYVYDNHYKRCSLINQQEQKTQEAQQKEFDDAVAQFELLKRVACVQQKNRQIAQAAERLANVLQKKTEPQHCSVS